MSNKERRSFEPQRTVKVGQENFQIYSTFSELNNMSTVGMVTEWVLIIQDEIRGPMRSSNAMSPMMGGAKVCLLSKGGQRITIR